VGVARYEFLMRFHSSVTFVLYIKLIFNHAIEPVIVAGDVPLRNTKPETQCTYYTKDIIIKSGPPKFFNPYCTILSS
jgi:hypothetical protein